MANIKHDPFFNTKKIEEIYSKQDGVPVKYVCTTALEADNAPLDIFYRDTPHPEFGNRYFGLFIHPLDGEPRIIGADTVEDYNIDMVETADGLIYSRYRHDCKIAEDAEGKGVMIDGGRAYTRGNGAFRTFAVVDGELVETVKEDA